MLLSGAVALIIAVATRTDPDRLGAVTVGNILTGGGSFAIPFIPIFVAIIGVFATGHEYRHGTIQPTLMAIPQRSTLLTAKIVMVALTAIVAVVLSVIINYVIGLLFWGQAPSVGADPLNQALAGYVVYAILYTVPAWRSGCCSAGCRQHWSSCWPSRLSLRVSSSDYRTCRLSTG